MKKIPTIYTFFGLFFFAFIFLSNNNNPPNGRTGAPGESTCASCHGGSGAGLDGNISILGVPSTIEPATNYSITIRVRNPNGVSQKAGFQMVVLDSNNDNTGTLSNPSAGSALQFNSFNNRNYMEHRPAQTYDANNTVTWTVDWLSPDSPMQDQTIRFYAAGNITDSVTGNNTSGDLIITTSSSGLLSAEVAEVLSAQTEATNILCAGDNTGSVSVSVQTGTPPYSYVWSNGATSATINNLNGGTYVVTVSDAGGNDLVLNETIQEPAPLTTFIAALNNPNCFGETGSADLQVTGGTAPYSFSNNNLDNLSPGQYNISVTDANGCSDIVQFDITQIDMLEATVLSSTPATDTNTDGTASLEVTGGSAPYTFSWILDDMVLDLGANPSNLAEGDYEVLITDANGCIISIFLTIDMTVNTYSLSLEQAVQLYPNPANNHAFLDIVLAEKKPVSVQVFNILGKQLLSFDKKNLQSVSYTLDLSKLNSGVYKVKIQVEHATVVKTLVVNN